MVYMRAILCRPVVRASEAVVCTLPNADTGALCISHYVTHTLVLMNLNTSSSRAQDLENNM